MSIAKVINLQHILYIAAFLSFGVGDGVSGAYMMKTLGVEAEANIAAKYLFIAYGFEGVVLAKIVFTLIVLFIAYIIKSRYSGMYWSVNGFLIALAVGGVMATNANISVIAGKIPQPPEQIILTYILLVLLLTEIGGIVDQNIIERSEHERG